MRTESSLRNFLTKTLGAFWLFDGLLQLQPKMFGSDFVTNILVPTLADQPSFMRSIVSAGITVWNSNPALMNTFVALIQIGIGALLFFPVASRQNKGGLYVSIIWGLIVWFCGEGMGLLLTGDANFYMGAPGAVLLYVVLAILLLIPEEKLSIYKYPQIAGWLFIFGSVLQMQKNFWSADGISGSIMTPMMDSVHAITFVPQYIDTILSLNPIAGNLLLALIPFVIGVLILSRPSKTVGVMTLVFLALTWWWGQDFGQLSAFMAATPTDPQASPLFALFVLPLVVAPERVPALTLKWSPTHLTYRLFVPQHFTTEEKERLLGTLIIALVVLGAIAMYTSMMASMSMAMPAGAMMMP